MFFHIIYDGLIYFWFYFFGRARLYWCSIVFFRICFSWWSTLLEGLEEVKIKLYIIAASSVAIFLESEYALKQVENYMPDFSPQVKGSKISKADHHISGVRVTNHFSLFQFSGIWYWKFSAVFQGYASDIQRNGLDIFQWERTATIATSAIFNPRKHSRSAFIMRISDERNARSQRRDSLLLYDDSNDNIINQ